MRHNRWMPIVLAWAGAAGCGVWSMLDYEYTPAAVDSRVPEWPADSKLQRPDGRPSLLMFLHPHCPCSRASIAELSDLAARQRDEFDLQVVFVRPPGLSDQWTQTDLWRTAESIRGARLFRDDDGIEAARFHVTASGETLLYTSAGQLAFHGGLTPSRGHRGHSAGRAALEAALRHAPAGNQPLPVFGCPLRNRCDLPGGPKSISAQSVTP